ncbi:putative Monocarboxylate transporter 7 [Hypsibius exemplaris]|uniref:Monocarboxylate transporter 7 n=1 Tax=Hypsibius exemplaris TaxID=2072580 RepID=A0A9X6NFQ4_HYPEX|nr:putative Monocarboxylate transporter 7 [Hypsibius exemplaris]
MWRRLCHNRAPRVFVFEERNQPSRTSNSPRPVMSQLQQQSASTTSTDGKPLSVQGGGGGGVERSNTTNPSLADGGRILRVRRADDGSLVAAEIVEEREDESATLEDVLEVSARTDRTPSHRNSEAVPVSAATACGGAIDKRDFNVLDGGYGWMVVFGCFLMHVVNVGLIKSFGIVFVELQKDYGASSAKASWIYSIFLVCSTWFAPLSSVLANAFTQRSIVILGGLMLGLGISLCCFANSLLFWYFSFGCLSGIGSALCYTPSVVAVGTYFEKRRALANGLSLSGAAVGSITVPMLMSHLIEAYTIPGAILIGGAFAFNVCVAGALLRPIATHVRILRAQERRAAAQFGGESAASTGKNLLTATNSDALMPTLKAFSAPASARSNGVVSLYGGEDSPSQQPNLLETPALEDRKRSAHSMPDEALNSATRRAQFRSTGEPSGRRDSSSASWHVRFRRRFRRKEGQPPLFDFSLFKVRLFLIYATAVMLSTFSYMIIFLILPSHAVDLGMTRDDGAKLVAIIGIADIFARIGFGWFSDLGLFHRKWGFCGAIYCAAACNWLVRWATNDIGLAVYAAFIGAASGSYISLVAVVCVDFFGLPRLSSALGSVIAFQGVAFLAGPPLISMMRDRTGSYDYGFLTLSVCLTVGASLIVLEHLYCLFRPRHTPPRPDPESNHEMATLVSATTSPGTDTPQSAMPVTFPVRPLVFSPPIAHLDEFDPLTPRPLSKPVFKPKPRKERR